MDCLTTYRERARDIARGPGGREHSKERKNPSDHGHLRWQEQSVGLFPISPQNCPIVPGFKNDPANLGASVPWARAFVAARRIAQSSPFCQPCACRGPVRGRFCFCCRRSQLAGYADPSPWPVPSSPYRSRQGDSEWLQAAGLSSYGGYDTALPSCFPRFCFILGRF
jgi:hypothetical protein